jgi:ubiquinone biosynthesis protein
MSSRADFVPAAYIRELSKFQDQTEATPWNEVERMLPARLLKELTDIEKTPLASASIGQVHTARLKSTNQKVVIKVQHPHARTLLTDDFRSLKIICRIIAWMEPDYSFMEILMSEWATEARKELNFCHEAEHLREAHSELKKLIPTSRHLIYTSSDDLKVPFQIEVPLPIEELSNQTVLVMNFCEGCRVNDFEQIGRWGLSRTAIMDGISQAFAHFMYCSAIFNADPHPGNILVRPGTTCADDDKQNSGFTLVLLDWGLAKRLPEQKRLAFCQMVYAAATFDYVSYRTDQILL